MENIALKETNIENPAEEVKNTNETTGADEEISLERINQLKELDQEVIKASSITEAEIEAAVNNPEKAESLEKKVSTLKKVVETLKDYAPAILTGAAAAAGIAVLSNMELPVSFEEMTNSGAYQAEKLQVFLVAIPTIAAGLFSLITGFTAKEIKAANAE